MQPLPATRYWSYSEVSYFASIFTFNKRRVMTTNLGPLTTIFTPPVSCLNIITSALGAGFFLRHFSAGNNDCYPPSSVTNLFNTSYLYSPGIVCVVNGSLLLAYECIPCLTGSYHSITLLSSVKCNVLILWASLLVPSTSRSSY
jgi:hypothetical protein